MTDQQPRDVSLAALAPYAGRWVALVRGRVAGVGWTRDEALRAARRNRPKETPAAVFIPIIEDSDGADHAA